MKSVRVKPKLTRMGEDVLLTSKDSAIMKSKRWAKEREGQLQRDQSDVPVRFKEIKNVGFTQHRCVRPIPPTLFRSAMISRLAPDTRFLYSPASLFRPYILPAAME